MTDFDSRHHTSSRIVGKRRPQSEYTVIHFLGPGFRRFRAGERAAALRVTNL